MNTRGDISSTFESMLQNLNHLHSTDCRFRVSSVWIPVIAQILFGSRILLVMFLEIQVSVEAELLSLHALSDWMSR